MQKNINQIAKTLNSKQLSLTKIWNKLIIANLVYSFSFIMLILALCFKQAFIKNKLDHANGAWIGNIVLSTLGIVFSLTIIGILIYFECKKCIQAKNKQWQKWSTITAWIPILGSIFSFIFKHKEKSNLSKDEKKYSPSPYTILLGLIGLIVLIIWIVYIVSGGIKTAEGDYGTIPGILDVLCAPIKGFTDASSLVIFLLIMGAFLTIVNQSKALEAGIGKLVTKMKKKEVLLIPILMLFFLFGATTFGMCEETVPFYFIVVPVMLAAGFDVITGFMIVAIGSALGIAGSIINPFTINIAVDATNQAIGSNVVSSSDGIIWRCVSFIILASLAITMVTLYALKVKKNPNKSIIYDKRVEIKNAFSMTNAVLPEFTTKRKVILSIFGLSFLVMIMFVINWQQLTGWDGFVRFHELLRSVFPFITSVGAMGTWYLEELSFLFLIASFICGAINWTSEENFINTFFNGMKDFIGVAIIVSIARGLSIILIESGINDVMVKHLANAMKSMHVITATLLLFFVFIILSFLIPSTSGFASAVFPIVGTTIYSSGVGTISGGILAFSLSNGMISTISPTVGPFVAGLGICKVSLGEYIKASWKILVCVFGAMILLLIAGAGINSVRSFKVM